MILSLIGYRGTGKSTVGRLLAERIGWSCVDADERIEQAAGKSIQAIFAEGGEPAFRDWESRVVAELCQQDKTVLAWGGGAILRAENREWICAAGPVVWLRADVATIDQRVNFDPSTQSRRPNLTTAGGRQEIENILAQRTPLYQQCADFQVDTEGMTPLEVSASIYEWWTKNDEPAAAFSDDASDF